MLIHNQQLTYSASMFFEMSSSNCEQDLRIKMSCWLLWPTHHPPLHHYAPSDCDWRNNFTLRECCTLHAASLLHVQRDLAIPAKCAEFSTNHLSWSPGHQRPMDLHGGFSKQGTPKMDGLWLEIVHIGWLGGPIFWKTAILEDSDSIFLENPHGIQVRSFIKTFHQPAINHLPLDSWSFENLPSLNHRWWGLI